MENCPSCGALLAPNLVAAIKDPTQPDVRCPNPWRGISSTEVPPMTDDIFHKLWDAIWGNEKLEEAGQKVADAGQKMVDAANKTAANMRGLTAHLSIVDETHDFHDQLPD